MNFVAYVSVFLWALLCTLTLKVLLSSDPSNSEYLCTLECIHVQISVCIRSWSYEILPSSRTSHALIYLAAAQIALKHSSSSMS